MKLIKIAKFAILSVVAAATLKAAPQWNFGEEPMIKLPKIEVRKVPSHLSMTKDQKHLVAAVVLLEANGEGMQGMQAVLNVIANRANADGISFYSVVREKLQFSCLNGITKAKAIAKARKMPKWNTVLDMIADAQIGNLADMTEGATHYHTVALGRTYWSRKMNVTIQIGQHLFFKEA